MSEYSKYTLEELIELKKKINQYINDYTDGYFYACNTLKYGHRSHHIYNNFEMARKVFLSYNGDNGFCDLYTNNPKILEIYSGGGDLYDPSKKTTKSLVLLMNLTFRLPFYLIIK